MEESSSTERGRRVVMGAYDLFDTIGVGGMGTVYRGQDRRSGEVVAVKVLTAAAASRAPFKSAFRDEIRACAGLDHPSIVRVLDRGETQPDVEAASQGSIPAHSPYLVMEYVGGGSLKPLCGKLQWPEIELVLLSVLDALAHAHARGLVHRDLKPANILLSAARDEVRLTDFGLVLSLQDPRPGVPERDRAGTPRYMAPEQCEGRWRDYGPWTDFYALGGVGWALASGRPPYGDKRGYVDLIMSQLEAPLPGLLPRHAVPRGFEAWLRRLLAKDPAERFRRASEAAAALRALGPVDAGTAPADEDDINTEDRVQAVTLGATAPVIATLVDTDHVTLTAADGRSRGSLLDDVPPTGPSSGLGLFWLRRPALAGRSQERSQLWSALREVVQTRTPRAVVLRGRAGCGKSRLAQWLAERAHELHGADHLHARHSAERRSSSALPEMLARHLRTVGLPYEGALERVLWQLGHKPGYDRDACMALAELMSPPASALIAETRPQHFNNRWEQVAVVQNVLQTLAEHPLVIWLDDAQWGADALVLARHVLEDAAERPILFVLTVQDEGLADRPLEADLLRSLEALPAVQSLRVEGLDEDALRGLLARLVHLEPTLVDWVIDNARGNPLFAVQTVGSWIDREILVHASRGFRLRAGEEVELDADLAAMWGRRVELFLRDRSPASSSAVELAAVLGQELSAEDWALAAGETRLASAGELLHGLLDGGLAERTGPSAASGWAFAHPLIRDALRSRARAAGRLALHHRLAARHLGIRGGRGSSFRQARHLVDAGMLEAALGPLAAGAWELIQLDELVAAEQLVEAFERALDQLDFAPTDSRRGQALLLRARFAARSGDPHAVVRWAGEAMQRAGDMGWEHIAIYMAQEFAGLRRRKGDLRASLRQLAEVAGWAERPGDRALLARAVMEQGLVAKDLGEPADAAALFQSASLLFEDLQENVLAGRAAAEQSECATRQGKKREARLLARAASEQFELGADRLGAAEKARLLALEALLDGRTERALVHFGEALRGYAALGSIDAARAEAGLGAALVLDARPADARRHLNSALARFEQSGERLEAARVRLCLVGAAALDDDWPTASEHLRGFAEGMGEWPVWEQELAAAAHMAARRAYAAGQERIAGRLTELVPPP